MEYRFESEPRNYEMFASGRVLYNAIGTTDFPVRLAGEIAQRCFDILERKGVPGPYSLYDPCCGGGYLLTVVGLLHGERLGGVYASDVDEGVLGIAGKNLSLLTQGGLDERKGQLRRLFEQYGKASHRDALDSAEQLDERLRQSRIGRIAAFRSDATAPERRDELPAGGVNIVLTDLPYGGLVQWRSDSADPLSVFLENVRTAMDPSRSVLAVIADKSQKLKHESFRRIQWFKAGKRQVGLFEPAAGASD